MLGNVIINQTIIVAVLIVLFFIVMHDINDYRNPPRGTA